MKEEKSPLTRTVRGEQKRKGRKERIERKERKGKERRIREEEGKRTSCSLHFFQRLADQGAGFVHAPRSRCFLFPWLFLLKGHSMAIRFNPNSRASPKIISIELLTI